jgi:hypothetical protein
LPHEEAQAVNNDPLYISFYSVVVKRSAVARSYPGGVEEFDRTFGAARSSDALSVMVAMSLSDVDWRLDRLFAAGLIPGADIAVAEMHHGPLLTCPGVAFSSNGIEFTPKWSAVAVEGPEGAVGSRDGREAYTPGNAFEYSWSPPGALESQEAPEAEAPEPLATPEAPRATDSTSPRRVVFGSGPVHWLYDDDDDEDDVGE